VARKKNVKTFITSMHKHTYCLSQANKQDIDSDSAQYKDNLLYSRQLTYSLYIMMTHRNNHTPSQASEHTHSTQPGQPSWPGQAGLL